MVRITTIYLEQTSAQQLPPAGPFPEPVVVERAMEPSPEFSRFLQTSVGGQWHWIGKLDWTWQQWFDWITRDGFETWVAYLHGTPIGYAELAGRREPNGTHVEIESFGLLPAFIGRGLGGPLLTQALVQAWSLASRWEGLPSVNRVWLHTNTLDSARALPNYLAHGLREFDTQSFDYDLDPTPPGPWPGAHPPTRPSPTLQEHRPHLVTRGPHLVPPEA